MLKKRPLFRGKVNRRLLRAVVSKIYGGVRLSQYLNPFFGPGLADCPLAVGPSKML